MLEIFHERKLFLIYEKGFQLIKHHVIISGINILIVSVFVFLGYKMFISLKAGNALLLIKSPQ